MGTIHSTGEVETRIDMEKNETQVRLVLKCLPDVFLLGLVAASYCSVCVQQKEPTLAYGMHRSKSKHELKLLEKIPENAEATVVLVGE